MKSKTMGSLFVVLTLVTAIGVFTPSAFADHEKVDVSITKGASTPGCEETKTCFDPSEATVDVGGEVTWKNDDTAAHTVTSGDLQSDPDNVGTDFDSSLFGPGKTFAKKFEKAGTFPYFCQVHPWMTGSITVEEATSGGNEEPTGAEEETYVNGMSADGSVKVSIGSSVPATGKPMTLDVKFTDTAGKPIQHINYAISVTQNGANVLSAENAHEHMGEGKHTTTALASDSPVDVQVTILGIGLPDQQANWTGPKGDIVKVQIVPEFGAIVTMVLAISIVSIIAITAKTRVIPKL